MLGDIAEHEQDTALPTVSTASEWDGTPAGVDGRRPMAWLPGAACPAWEFSPIGTVSYPLERAGAALEHPSGRPARQWLLPERGLIEAGGPDLVGRRWSQLAARNAPVMPATMGTRDAEQSPRPGGPLGVVYAAPWSVRGEETGPGTSWAGELGGLEPRALPLDLTGARVGGVGHP